MSSRLLGLKEFSVWKGDSVGNSRVPDRDSGPFAALALALLLAPLQAGGASGEEAAHYWLWDGGRKSSVCLRVDKLLGEIPGHLRRQYGTECRPDPETMETDTFVGFKCADGGFVVAFATEMQCSLWATREPTSKKQGAFLAAFGGCMETARKRLPLDDAFQCCRCTASEMDRHSEAAIAAMSREALNTLLNAVAANCASTRVGAEPPPAASGRERLYLHACATGVGAALEALPAEERTDALRSRGLNSCQGSLTRLIATGELEKEPNIPEFACGYAVGAMFAKVGLSHEVQPSPSPRALSAMTKCMSNLENQGARSVGELQARAPVGGCYKHAVSDVVVKIDRHMDGATLVRAWRNGKWSEAFSSPPSTFGEKVRCPGR